MALYYDFVTSFMNYPGCHRGQCNKLLLITGTDSFIGGFKENFSYLAWWLDSTKKCKIYFQMFEKRKRVRQICPSSKYVNYISRLNGLIRCS